jgi:ABC-type Mn2+/Zn2+ transport system permease subunit
MVFLIQDFGQLCVVVLRVHLTVFGSLFLVKMQDLLDLSVCCLTVLFLQVFFFHKFLDF